MTGINTNYSQFYKGSEYINNSGSAAGKKDTAVHYEFNTTDEKGNKIMDRMSKEETFRTMKDISSQYGDNVIVEFSGDGLSAFEEHKGKIYLPEEHTEIPEEMMTYLEGPEPLTADQIAMMNQRHGDDPEAVMKNADPDAFAEYERIRDEGLAEGTEKGMTAGFRYMYKWMTQRTESESKQIDEEKNSQDVLGNLSSRFKNADFSIGSGDKFSLSGAKEFGIVLSEEELNVLKNGSDDEKDKIYQLIEESIKKLSDMKNSHGDEDPFKVVNFGVSVGKDNAISFLAQSKDQSFMADSIDSLMEKLGIDDNEKKENA